jgi:hypothetical protein
MRRSSGNQVETDRQTGMDRQILRDWVHRYNETGVAGLMSRVPPGATPKWTDMQMAALRELVVTGPDPKAHRLARWRCIDVRAETGVLMRHIRRVPLVDIDRSHCVEIIEECGGVRTSRILTGDDCPVERLRRCSLPR